MKKYSKARKEFNENMQQLKKERQNSIYENNLSEIILYNKLLEIHQELILLKQKMEIETTA